MSVFAVNFLFLRLCRCLHSAFLFYSQEVMSAEDESTSCYCLLDSGRCHLLLSEPGSYALVGEALCDAATKRLKVAVFGSSHSSMSYSLRVYCVDDTPHAFQVSSASAGLSSVMAALRYIP